MLGMHKALDPILITIKRKKKILFEMNARDSHL
jgi:hypothetical protein